MSKPAPDRGALRIVILIALARVLLNVLSNNQYGFHRDELATLEDARHLAWGYVAYPPVTPLFGRLSLELFGTSLAGFRFFASLAQGAAIAVSGLIARELGGKRLAQVVACVAVAVAPMSLVAGSLMQYVSFDYLWWVLLAYTMLRLVNSGNPRWWLAAGAAIGVGMMTKYTMGFLVAGVGAGVLLTGARQYLRSRWLWYGAALSVLIFVPNLVWQIRHDFITLDFLQSIHARDVRIGRTASFLTDQLWIPALPLTIPLWVAGLAYYFAVPEGKRYRLVGWMLVVPFVLFLAAQGRGYYMGPAYPMLLAAGAVLFERWAGASSILKSACIGAMLAGGIAVAAVLLPIAPANSRWWDAALQVNGDLREEIGWQEFVETVAGIRDSLPPQERASAGILAGNYGEAGAINLYGPAHGLPEVISGTNSFWLRGYGGQPPQTLIATGFSREFLERTFASCALAGHITNRYGVRNEETADQPDIYVCRQLRDPWAEFWKRFRRFG